MILLAVLLCLAIGGSASAEAAADRMAIAQAQHDMLVLLIDKGEYDKVPAEFQKILDLRFTGADEQKVVSEVLILSDLLVKKSQAKVSLRLVDMGLGSLKEKDSLVKLYKEKGFLYKTMGQPEKAMEMFEKVKALEASGSSK
jgi:tetratricopeptide (TPR) repeat protein